MIVATISPNRVILLLAAVSVSLIGSQSDADGIVSIWLDDHRKYTAEVHPRTNDELLWLRFGNDQTVVLRGVAWERITEATIDDESVDAAKLRQLASQQVDPGGSDSPQTHRPASDASYADQAHDLLGFHRRVSAVDFDVHLANWDRDVEFDGLVLRLFPLDAEGQLTCVRGTLHVELVAAKRHKFNDVPSARGQVPSRLGQWIVTVNANEVTENGVVVKLPFQTIHPESDTSWGTHGLVHVRFVVPGHGVFEHSFDGVRVRAYAPFRDALQRQTGQRFLPMEGTGISKSIP